MRTSEVLPVPLGPSTARNSPSCRSKLRSSQSTRAPKRSDTWRARTTAAAAALTGAAPAEARVPARAATPGRSHPAASSRSRRSPGSQRSAAAVRIRVVIGETVWSLYSSTRTLCSVKSAVISRDCLRRRVASVLDRAGEGFRRQASQACGSEQVARHRLGVGHGRAAVACADRGNLPPQWPQALLKAHEARSVVPAVGRIRACEARRDRRGDPGRAGARRTSRCGLASPPADAEHVRHGDNNPAGAGRRGLELLHEAVVAHPVLDHERGLGHCKAVVRAGLEQVRIGIRIAQNRGDRHMRSADLGHDVPIEVLGRHDLDPPMVRRRRRPACGQGEAGDRQGGSKRGRIRRTSSTSPHPNGNENGSQSYS